MLDINSLSNIFLFIGGPPGSGKDTSIDKILEERYIGEVPVIKYTFSDQVKRGLLDSLGMRNQGIHDFDDDKDKPRPEFNGKSFRQACIIYSEDFMKPLKGLGVFAEIVVNDIHNRGIHDSLIIITGAGFTEELDVVANVAGIENMTLIDIVREGRDYTDDSRYSLKDYPITRDVIYNDKDLDTLQMKVKSVVDHFVEVKYYPIQP